MSKQKHLVKSTSDIKEKVLLTNLTAIFSKSSLEIGKEMLDNISELIHSLLIVLKSNDNLQESLDLLISQFSPKNSQKIFSASRTSCKNIFPKETKKELDQRLQGQYQKSMKELENLNAKSNEIILSIDTSSELTKSKYINNCE